MEYKIKFSVGVQEASLYFTTSTIEAARLAVIRIQQVLDVEVLKPPFIVPKEQGETRIGFHVEEKFDPPLFEGSPVYYRRKTAHSDADVLIHFRDKISAALQKLAEEGSIHGFMIPYR